MWIYYAGMKTKYIAPVSGTIKSMIINTSEFFIKQISQIPEWCMLTRITKKIILRNAQQEKKKNIGLIQDAIN